MQPPAAVLLRKMRMCGIASKQPVQPRCRRIEIAAAEISEQIKPYSQKIEIYDTEGARKQ